MLRFILKRQLYDGACLNALEVRHYTVDCDVPALELALCSGGKGGGPDGDAFDISEVIGVEVLRASKEKAASTTEER